MMSRSKTWQTVLRLTLALLVTVVISFPTYWMVTLAFKPPAEWSSAGGKIYWIPENPTLDNFQRVLTTYRGQFFRAAAESALPSIRSSIITSIAGTLFALLIGTLAAYGLSRYPTDTGDLPWFIALGTLFLLVLVLMPFFYLWARLGILDRWWGIISFTALGMVANELIGRTLARIYGRPVGSLSFSILQLRMFPPMAILIPVMIMWSALRLNDTWYGLSFVYGVVTFPFVVWLMKSFFDEVPRELDEAAIVDGSSYWRAFFKVVLPLVKGGLATTALFVFILNWSDFLIALLLTSRTWGTIPVFLNGLVSAEVGAQHGPKAALGLIAIIPPVVFGLLIQQYLVRGLTFGAIKK
jgi:ABC-type glycerol-3-phosphate transport system permease component